MSRSDVLTGICGVEFVWGAQGEFYSSPYRIRVYVAVMIYIALVNTHSF